MDAGVAIPPSDGVPSEPAMPGGGDTIAALREAVDRLNSEKSELKDCVENLRTALHLTESERIWYRLAYEDVQKKLAEARGMLQDLHTRLGEMNDGYKPF